MDELLCLHRTHGASMALANVIKHLKFRARKLQQGLKGHHPLQSFACAAWADEMVSTDARHYKRPPAKADPAALSFRASDRCSNLSFRQGPSGRHYPYDALVIATGCVARELPQGAAAP